MDQLKISKHIENIKKYYMIIIPVIIMLFVTIYNFIGSSKSAVDGMITVHETYSKMLEVGLFPEPVASELKEILKDNSDFRLSDYYDVETVITKHCQGEDFSWWKNTVSMLPVRAFLIMAPMGMEFFYSPEVAIKRQIKIANTCEWHSYEYYMYSGEENAEITTED